MPLLGRPDREELRGAVRELCARFADPYWREVDQNRCYPKEFVAALTEAGWLGVLIPEEYGWGGLGVTDDGVVLEEIGRKA